MNPTSYIELDREALAFNIAFLRDMIGDKVKLSSVVKGNAYGHGIDLFVPMAFANGIDHFSVFSAEEADKVFRIVKNKASIMIMGMIDDEQLEWAIANGIEFYVFDLHRLYAAIRMAKQLMKKAKIHLEFETGMNRTGVPDKAVSELISALHQNRKILEIKGICTHLAGAESIANYYRIRKQLAKFKKLSAKLARHDLTPEYRHVACSAVTMRYPAARFDMVRIGILQYGFFPSREVLIDHMIKTKSELYPLKRIISWKSKIMDVKTVKAGEFVGYGTSYLTNDAMKIALIPVGYSNGFSRVLSNQGRVLIRGHRVGVVGMVNMNLISVDVSSIEEVQRGDEVVIIGDQGDLEISVASFSDITVQINYEVLTRLPEDIPRIIIN